MEEFLIFFGTLLLLALGVFSFAFSFHVWAIEKNAEASVFFLLLAISMTVLSAFCFSLTRLGSHETDARAHLKCFQGKIVYVGGCNGRGQCSVQYTETSTPGGDYGFANMPSQGQTLEVCRSLLDLAPPEVE